MKTAYLILILILFSACRAKQITNESHYQEQTKVQNDVTLQKSIVNENKISEDLRKIIDDKLKVTITKITYDTSKPIDPSTGKHPVLQEENINIDNQTNITEDNTKEEENKTISDESEIDKSIIETEIDQADKGTETIEQSTFEKVLDSLKLLVIGVVVFVVMIVARKIYLKIMKSRS